MTAQIPHKLALDASESQRTFDANGFLHVRRTPISKECVNPYYGREIPGWQDLNLDPEKIYMGYRPGEELAKAASTFDGLPLLLRHAVVTPEKPQKEQRVGSVATRGQFEAPYLYNGLIIDDAMGIDAVESGEAEEISSAYAYDPDFTPGTFDGVKYDFVMRNIRGNHVALVEEGRAGPDVVVADSQINPKPQGNIMKGMKKAVAWAKRVLAQDADPNIEKAEVDAAKEILAVNKVEAKEEGLDPKDLGLDEDKDAKIKKILALFPDLDPEKAKSLADALQELAYEPDENKTATDEDKTKDEPALDAEAVKAALDKCGLDAESPEFQKAFAEGVKYGEEKEKAEPSKLDSEHESEGAKKAMDAALRRMCAATRRAPTIAADAAVAHVRALNTAARAVAPLMGSIVDPMAFDSADDIYGKALDVAGVDKRQYPRTSWRGMCDVLLQQRTGIGTAPVTIAQDANGNITGPGQHLKNIRVEG